MEEVDKFDSRFEGSWGNVGVLDALNGMREEDGGVDEDELKYGNDWAIVLGGVYGVECQPSVGGCTSRSTSLCLNLLDLDFLTMPFVRKCAY